MDPLDIHGSIHGSMDVDVPLGSMDVDVTNIHGYPSSDFTAINAIRGSTTDESTLYHQLVNELSHVNILA
jgi:hypothetical protein